ncbi:MAG: hypothetical protein ACXAEN_18555 [Candidatus Thorarchaeota archaeon]
MRKLDDDTKVYLIGHIAQVEATMGGSLGIAISMLVFPLALYTPSNPNLLLLAVLGYICSWGFLWATLTGICLRIRAFNQNSELSYFKAMETLSNSFLLTVTSVATAIVSTVILMLVPPLYVASLPPPIGLVPGLGTLVGVTIVMATTFGCGIAGMILLAVPAFLSSKKKPS